jgi:hypothetical protein
MKNTQNERAGVHDRGVVWCSDSFGFWRRVKKLQLEHFAKRLHSFHIRPTKMATTRSWNERKTRDPCPARPNDEEKDRNSVAAAAPPLTTAAPFEPGTSKTKSARPPSWQFFRNGFPVRRILPPLRLKVLQSSSLLLEDYVQHQHNEASFTSTVGESASSSASLSSLDEPQPAREDRHVRFASTLELEREIQFSPPLSSADTTDDHGVTTRDGSADCSATSSCCWYSRDELARMGQERRQELNVLSASSRGLALYRRRGSDSKAFGRVLYQLLQRFRHEEAPAKDQQEQKNDDDDDKNDDESFSIDHADFQLLQRYIAQNALVTGVERNVVESVASETRALIGNVQQSVLMAQDILSTMRQQGNDHDRVEECLRCASIRYSAPSQRFARALGEVHSQVVNVPT